MEYKAKTVSPDEWEKHAPPPKEAKPSPYDKLLSDLEAGEILEVPMAEKDFKGFRIGIARRARTRGFKLEFRSGDEGLLIRKSEEPLSEPKPKTRDEEGAKRGRPRKAS